MAMWGGVVAGIDMFNEQKNTEKELKVRMDGEKRLQEQFDENKKLNRLNQVFEIYEENQTRNVTTTKNAEDQADAVMVLNNRFKEAAANMPPEEVDQLAQMVEQLSKVPSKALKVLSALDKYNSDFDTQDIQFSQLPEIINIINFTEGDPEETKITLSQIYGVDIVDDKQFEELMKLASISPKLANLTVDFNPLKVKEDDARFYQDQVSIIDKKVLSLATADKNSNPKVQAAIDTITNIDPKDQRAVLARMTLYNIYMDTEMASSLSETDETNSKYFKDVQNNPLLSGLINPPQERNTQNPVVVNPDSRDSEILISKQNDPNFTEIQKKFDDRYGAGASTKVLQKYFASQGQ